MDFYDRGLFYKEISVADVDNMVSIADKAVQSIVSSEVVDHKRSAVYRLEVRLRKLKDELRYVLDELGVSSTSVGVFKDILGDDVIPDTVAESSSKVNSSEARKINHSVSSVTELKEQVEWISGDTYNRIMKLIREIRFLNSHIKNIERGMKATENVRKKFEQRKRDFPEEFDKLRDQIIAVAEMRGYLEALISLVQSYPESTTTDRAIRTTNEQFDRACITWIRYRRRLFKAVGNFVEKYSAMYNESKVLQMAKELGFCAESQASEPGISFKDLKDVLTKMYNITYDTTVGQYKYEGAPARLLTSIKEMFENRKYIPKHFTGIPGMKADTTLALYSLSRALSTFESSLSEELVKWSGGAAHASSNPAVKKIIDKARQAVLSPVRATTTSPLKRDAYIEGSLQDFKKAVEGVKKARQFMEQTPDKIREALAKKAEEASRDTIRKILLRRDMPTKNNRKGLMPVEDAIRARVRKRYGNIPFEDEVNIGTQEEPIWAKEKYCEQVKVKSQDGAVTERWALKSTVRMGLVEGMVREENNTLGQ